MTPIPWYADYDFWSAAGTIAAVALALFVLVADRVATWWRRPVLRVTYQNAMPWRRWAQNIDDQLDWRLYFRVAVSNRGLTTARNVRAQLAEWTDHNGALNPYLDPLMLHWVGTDFTPISGIDLLPGATEYVDVFSVATWKRERPQMLDNRKQASEFNFQIIPQNPIPRGIAGGASFDRQQLRVVIAGENVDAVAVLWRLPKQQSAGIDPSAIEVHSEILTGVAVAREITATTVALEQAK